MKVLFLTTQTPHHAYFVQEVIKKWPECHAVLETTGVKPPFDISHETDMLRDTYEIKNCLGGHNAQISDLINTIEVKNINDEATSQYIQSWKPDIIIDFGTRKVKSHIIDLLPDRIVNLHGGDPEQYRGLDSHMWAMYHNDFSNLVTALHTLNPQLDDGAIIKMMPVHVFKGMKIHEFRRYNTETCITMVCEMLQDIKDGKGIQATPQSREGRYYSFMPTVLKNIAIQKFEKYTAQINE